MVTRGSLLCVQFAYKHGSLEKRPSGYIVSQNEVVGKVDRWLA